MAPGGRGALIVLEGCDRAGKSTQVRMLVDALNKQNILAEPRNFPDRKTPIGTVINNFLTKKQDFAPEAIHLLFSANRWECKADILQALQNGVTLIVDRYAASGAAYTAATTGRPLDWCKEPDKGLPCPDMVFFLKISQNSRNSRSDWGGERFEIDKIQQLVASNFEKLQDNSWTDVDGEQEKSAIHSEIFEKVLRIVEQVRDLPVGTLYESDKWYQKSSVKS